MRFAVLHHTDWPGHPDHYDLLLQYAEGDDDDARVLKTFATTADTLPVGSGEVLQRLADHRRSYLHYEGPVSQGRGHVTRMDEGDCEILSEVRDIQMRLAGKKLAGNFILRQLPDGVFTFGMEAT